MAVEVGVQGLAELERRLTQLVPKAARRALNAALMAGARIVVKEAKSKAPKRTGNLKRNITARVARRGDTQATAAVHIGVRKDAFYWMFHELGTSQHPARPFLRPALEITHEAVVAKIAERLAQRIEIEAGRS